MFLLKHLLEALRIRGFPLILAEGLLIKVSEQMEWFHARVFPVALSFVG